MEAGFKVRAEVVKVRRNCPLGHKVGDAWEFGAATPGGLCIYAFLAFSPAWSALQAGGSFSWEEDPDAAHFSCPDDGEVVFRLRRLRAEGEEEGEVLDQPGDNPEKE